MKYFASDLHLNHERLMRFSRSETFSSVEEMNETITENMIQPLRPGDELFLLGDLSWSKDTLEEFFKRIPKKVNCHWILGNHDQPRQTQYASRWLQYCKSISLMKEIRIQGHHVTLCHYPMLTWNKSHYDSWMLFGHHHRGGHGSEGLAERTLGKMLNVNVEFHDFKPWSEDEIVAYMESRPNNWDYIDKRGE